MPVTTRLATPTDVDSILTLMRKLQDDDPWSEPFDETAVRACVKRLLPKPEFGLIYLCFDEANPVAYLVICFDFSLEYRGKGAWIDELFVERSYRAQGIGTQLLDVAERVSREHGAQFLHLEVNHGNRAIELYRRRGFVDHARYLMTKDLKPAEPKDRC